jgi:glycosyltransferase involved in cell wall biosynthesis
LDWPSDVTLAHSPRFAALERISELLQVGRKDAIYWSPTHRGPLKAHHHVVSVHDCINVEYSYRDDWRLPAFRSLFNLILANAQAVVALSHATRDAILRNYKVSEDKLFVIPAGFEIPTQSSGITAPQTAHPETPFALIVTNTYSHKNNLAACRAWAASDARKDFKLRVVGSVGADAQAYLSSPELNVEVHARVEDSTLAAWYQTCAFLFSPNLEEGYNLPIAEALASGANVLCSDIAVHREFYARYASFFDPRSDDAMIAALNAAFGRSGRWHVPLDTGSMRTYRDVAAEYRALFLRIEQCG